MRLSRFYLVTTRETPADAELASHRLMLRAGMIRKHGAGLYSWLPLGLRALRRVEAIVREEMNRAGAQEVLMPSIQPAELWQESGRWEQMGPEMLRLQDRHARDFCYGPTHEEIVTHLVRQDVKSYRQLPFNLYQIQTKFRDETRPRFGVMRAREFLMKDAYSFHADHADLVREYGNMRETYTRIFTRLGVDFRAVQADSGNIGGSASEEFHVIADAGEDLLALSTGSDYAANLEAATSAPPAARPAGEVEAMTKVATPGQRTCEQVSTFLGVPLAQKVKLLVVDGADGGLVALALRGDHTLNEIKAGRLPEVAQPLALAEPKRVAAAFGAETGYLGPVNVPADVPVVADRDAHALAHFTCGANETDHHLRAAAWGRDCPEPVRVADLRNVVEGDPSPDGQGTLFLKRGIEGGHIFQLGRKYTAAMNATVQGEDGQPLVPEMGCYGIGVSRLVAAVIEQCHDERGIRWPVAVAPFTVLICPIGSDRSAPVRETAERLYEALLGAGIDAALDDRGLRPGPMFADADLIGVPFRVVVGDKGLANGQVEAKARVAEAPVMIPATPEAVRTWIREASGVLEAA